MKIDWNQLELNSNNSKEISFERFCYHFAAIMFEGRGELLYPYNAAGSEFYLELRIPIEYEGKKYKKGDVIGWQAKFWVNHSDLENSSLGKSHREELKKGLKNTLKRHSKLALWIVCTPGQFVEDYYTKLKTELVTVSDSVSITHWHKTIFESALTGTDRSRYQGVFAYYFSKKIVSKVLLDRLTKASIDTLQQKFDIDLHIASSFESQLMGIIDKDVARRTLTSKLENLNDRIERYKKRWYDQEGNRIERGSRHLGKDFTTSLCSYERCVLELSNNLVSLLQETDVDIVAEKGLAYINEKDEDFREAAMRLMKLSEQIIRSSNEVDLWNYYVEDIFEIKNFLFGQVGSQNDSIKNAMLFRKAHYFPIFAQAGYGKTHFACSLASAQLANGMPVLLLTGSRFSRCDRPQDVFLNVFEMGGIMTFDELISSLDLMASFYNGGRLPIVIDGLNESFPNESVWRNELPLIVKSIENTEHLILVTTCREKTEYIQKIYGQTGYEKVENASLLTGIEDFNLQETVHKYFRKYDILESNPVAIKIFRNPLLLKIFCEVNKGSRGMTVNEYSLTESMKRYSENLVDQLSKQDGAIDRMVRHKVVEGLKQMGRLLWERKTRVVDYYDDFYPLFGNRTEALLEEGLCFQIDNISQNSGEVKFTYDLLAGYHIAVYLVSQTKNVDELSSLLYEVGIFKSLFGEAEELHPLSEDVVRSLIFIIRERYQKSMIEVVTDDNALAKILNGLDLICVSKEEREALSQRLKSVLSAEVKKTICTHVKDKLSEYNSVTGVSALLPAFQGMSQEDFDKLFHCQFLSYRTLFEAVNCVRKYMHEPIFEEDALTSALLLTGCYSNEYHQELIRILVRYARTDFVSFSQVAAKYLTLNDPYIREAIYIVTHGAVVGRGNKENVSSAVTLLTEDLRTRPSSHIIILDCCESLFDYAQVVFGMDMDRSVLGMAKDVKWDMEDENAIWKSGVYDYDFEKFHIRPYSVMGYDSKSKYTSDELQGMILWRMKKCGYRDEVYDKLRKDYSDNHKYYQEYVKRMPFKHVESAQRELVGWLLLNGLTKPEYKGTLRMDEVEIDPSYPGLYPRKQLISASWLPKSKNVKAQWIKKNPITEIKQYLERRLPGNEDDWVLLYGHLRQKNIEKEAEILWRVESGLAHCSSKKKKVELPAKSHSHLFASEIGWRKMDPNIDDYYHPSLGVFLMQKYEFSGWSSERPSIPNFRFLTEQIRQDFGLQFRQDELRYYRGEERMTETFQDGSSEFFYIKKKLIEEIKSRYNVNLVQEINAEKIDTHHEKGNYVYNAFKEYKETVVK